MEDPSEKSNHSLEQTDCCLSDLRNCSWERQASVAAFVVDYYLSWRIDAVIAAEMLLAP